MIKPKPGPTPQTYLWDYDRTPAEATTNTYRFSISVFQWLPKASGKGLKRSNTGIRIHGYHSDPQAVFDKAEEVCWKFNEAKVDCFKPPSWAQKQYSVPRPKSLPPPTRFSDGLTGAQVRSIRLRVMRDRLLKVGFVKGKEGTYAREVGGQIHVINFQADKWGGEYFVNLGFHYSFMLPQGKLRVVPLSDYCFSDCVCWGRLPGIFKYGYDKPVLESQFYDNVDKAIEIFERCLKEWEKPENFLQTIDGLKPWSMFDRDLFMVQMELHQGKIPEATARMNGILISVKNEEAPRKFIQQLWDAALIWYKKQSEL